MKRTLSLFMCALLMLAFMASCAPAATPETSPSPEATPAGSATPGAEATPAAVVDPTQITGEITWWTYFDQSPFLKDEFNKIYPNVKINLEIFGGDEYKTKLLTTLQSGKGIPDMLDLEEEVVYRYLDTDLFVDLSELGGQDLGKDYYPWALDLGRDSNGVLRAMCDNVSPVAFWYTRSAMKEYLGTDDDVEIAAKLSDWDKIIQTARDVKEKSGGKVFLLENIGMVVKAEGYSITPFVRDGKFSVDPKWIDLIEIERTLHNEGLTADLNSWSGEWASAWNEGTLLTRVMPSWDFFTDWDKNSGNVGVAQLPHSSYEGGTYHVISKDSPNKEACMAFINFLSTADYQIANLTTNNQMPASTAVVASVGADFKAEKFGNQNILKTYSNICNSMTPIIPDKYTREVQNKFSKHVREGIKAGLSNDDIIKNFKAEVKELFPEIEGL